MTRTIPTPSLPKIIALSLLLYRGLLSLGPATFRRDYAAPALQAFQQCCRDAYQQQRSFGVLRLWPGLLGETISGLLAEYWTEFFGKGQPQLPVVRRLMVAVFWAFVLFLFAFVALRQTADPVAPFNAVERLHPDVAITYVIFANSGIVALLTILLSALPILFTSIKRALAESPTKVLKLFLLQPKQALVLFGGSLIIAICFIAYLWGTEYIFGSPGTACQAAQHCLGQQAPAMILLNLLAGCGAITLGVFVVLLIGAALSSAVLRSDFGTGMLRFALAPIGILALAMATATLASTIWIIRLWIDAPQFAASGSGLGSGQTAWVIATIVAMAVSTIITAGAFISGLRVSLLPTSSIEEAF